MERNAQFGEPVEQMISKAPKSRPFGFLRGTVREKSSRFPHANTERKRQRSRSKPRLLPPSKHQRGDAPLNVTPDVNRADPLRRVHLVTGKADQVGRGRHFIQRDGRWSLRRIEMQQGPSCCHAVSDPSDILDRTDFGVHRPDRYNQYVVGKRSLQGIIVDHAAFVYGDGSCRESTRGKVAHDVQRRFMFNIGCQYLSSFTKLSPICNPQYCDIIRLRRAGCEYDLVRIAPNEARNGPSGIFDCARGRPPQSMIR